MKPRRPPPVRPLDLDDEDAFADFCVALVEALQVPEVADAVADVVAARLPSAAPLAPSPVLRHSPPARGRYRR